MTVAVGTPLNAYTSNGSASSFAFTFPVFDNTQVLVVVTSPAGTGYTLTLGTDYTVSGLSPAGDPASAGTVNLVNAAQAWLTGANLTTDWIITIQRNFLIEQTTSFRNGGDFYRDALEDALDYIVYLIQQNQISGITLTDIVTGYVYRLEMINGVLSQVRIS
jgi:hypothetical protein